MLSLKTKALPEKRETLFSALKLLINPMEVAPGCLQCRLFEDTSETGIFLISEEWRTRDDLVHRIRTDHFKKLLTVIELSSTLLAVRCEKIRNANGIETIIELEGEQYPSALLG